MARFRSDFKLQFFMQQRFYKRTKPQTRISSSVLATPPKNSNRLAHVFKRIMPQVRLVPQMLPSACSRSVTTVAVLDGDHLWTTVENPSQVKPRVAALMSHYVIIYKYHKKGHGVRNRDEWNSDILNGSQANERMIYSTRTMGPKITVC